MLSQIEKGSQNLEEKYKEIKIVREDDREHNVVLKLHGDNNTWRRDQTEEKREIIKA